MPTSFFSYSRSDQNFASKLADDLRKNGINIWFDQIDIPKGSLWDVEVEKALKKCDTLIVIISSSSINSNNVLDEISYAIEEGKKIIPVKISNCDIPFRIRRLQYIDFTKNEEIAARELYIALGQDQVAKVSSNIFLKKIGITKKRLIFISIVILFFITVLSLFSILIKDKIFHSKSLPYSDTSDSKPITSNTRPLNLIDSTKLKDSLKILNLKTKQVKETTTATLVDANGNEIITLKKHFDKKMPYYEGLAAVKKGNKWGFVDINDKIVIPFIYNDVGYYMKGYALVQKTHENWNTVFINKAGEEFTAYYHSEEITTMPRYTWLKCSENGELYPHVEFGYLVKTPTLYDPNRK